jgi:hypothetical protein
MLRLTASLLLLAALASPASAGAACPVDDALGEGGRWLEPRALARLEEQIDALPPGLCAQELSRAIVDENGPAFVEAMMRATDDWPGEVAEPWLLDLWAAAWFYPGGRREDALAGATSALERRLAGRDPLDLLLADPDAHRWPLIARERYLSDWAPGLSRAAPPSTEQERARTTAAWLACLQNPGDAPPDPFDPLNLRGGVGGRLGEGARCASAAVIQGWRDSEDEEWREAVRSMLWQYSAAVSAFGEASLALERAWGQGHDPGGGTPLQPPIEPAPPDPFAGVLGGLLAFVAVALLLSAPRRTRKLGLPLAAVAFGLGLIGAVELLLRLGGGAGAPDRPGPPLELQALNDQSEQPWLRDQRGRPFTQTKPPGTVRIGVVGASSVAGPGLSWADSLPRQLTRFLAPAVPCVEVLNLGQHGADSTSFRSHAFQADEQLDLDAVVLYGGHNEVAGSREAHRYLELDPGSIRRRSALGRLAIWNRLTHAFARPAPLEALSPEEIDAARERPEHDYRVYDPVFEATVTARAERELMELARGLRRRGTPLVVTIPSFNHHGLRVSRPPDEEHARRLQVAIDAVIEGDVDKGLADARALVAEAPENAATWNVLSLAQEAAGDLAGAEASIWEVSRRNHQGSAVTPGVVEVLRRAAQVGGVLADAHGALHVAAGRHLPGFDLFVDFVHLNPTGSAVVAESIAGAAKDAGLVARWAARCGDAPPGAPGD